MNQTWDFGDDEDATSGAPEESTAFPWPPGESEAILATFAETWRSATFSPAGFFRRVPRDHGTPAALAYYLGLVLLVAGVTLFWDSLSTFAGATMGREWVPQEGAGLHPLVTFLLTPAILFFSLFLSAAVSHVLLLLLGGAEHGFGTTVRVFAYAYSPGLFGIVPLLGAIVGGIWMVVLLIIGLREAHETDGWKSGVAVLLPLVLMLGMLAIGFMLMLAAGAALLPAG